MTAIDTEARGKLRALRKDLLKRFDRVEATRVSNATKTMVMGMQFLPMPDRQRIAKKLCKRFDPDAKLMMYSLEMPLFVWATLKPREAVRIETDDPSDSQDCVVVEYLACGRIQPDLCGTAAGLWNIVFNDHAIARLMQRHRSADAVAVMWEASKALLCADTEAMLPYCANPDQTFYLKAGPGAFACQMQSGWDVSAYGMQSFHAIARTWLHADQLGENQTTIEVAETFREAFGCHMLPAALRSEWGKERVIH
jgi:hypothetical protein